MVGTALARGDRPAGTDWLGLMCATTGLIGLTIPGATAPNLTGTALMAAAGACWGAYSLAGRSARHPLAETAWNFRYAAVLGALFVAASVEILHATATGIVLACASGALASGVAYTLWYAALPALGSLRAAVVQLLVPILTGAAAAILLGEVISARLLIAGALVGLGVLLTVWPRHGWAARREP
jgi:drug/metabolite transporter (DMT)-like permease